MGGNWQVLGLVTQLGLTMVVSLILGLVAGQWVDGHVGTAPWGTLALTVLGALVGSYGIYRMVTSAIDQATVKESPIDEGPARQDGQRVALGETVEIAHQATARPSGSLQSARWGCTVTG